jgi:hypothetical protein
MKSGLLVRNILLVLSGALFVGLYPAAADSNHARIIRLSLVQGDVRFTRASTPEAVSDQNASWETAELNLPIRQGYVLATGNGRAEVEFENGSMAFLNENTVLEFYDLTLENGGRNTRLVLRQGAASFYVNPANEDYFSVTGGDFTAVAGPRSSFRMDNSDGGSTVGIIKGRINVIHGGITTPVVKGQSLSMQAGQDAIDVGRLSNDDDFDRWVSGRVDSVVTATNAALQYTSSPYYSSGFADLYTYGSWYPVSGYGNCWRPYGVGYGWSPFNNGGWFSDPFFGASFIGSQPWGWLPYHFGSWIFDPIFGWLWVPGGFGYGGFVNWAPVTGRFVRSRTGLLGVVPAHPLDVHGKAPINLAQGVMPVKNGVIAPRVAVVAGEEWKTVKNPPREIFGNEPVHVSAPPVRATRAFVANNTSERAGAIGSGSGSTITYDPREHRFVNSNPTPVSGATASETLNENAEPGKVILNERANTPAQNGTAATNVATVHGAITPPPTSTTARASVPVAPVRTITPPPAPRTSGSNGANGARGGYSGAEASRGVTPSHSSSPPASHPSSAPSGGRPH